MVKTRNEITQANKTILQGRSQIKGCSLKDKQSSLQNHITGNGTCNAQCRENVSGC